MRQKTSKPIISKAVKATYTEAPIKIRKLKDAKRLLSRLIYNFQQGSITGRDAKDLTYLLISYVNICGQTEFEERLIKLEKVSAK